ncbi:MAG: DNA mismatch repair protein MutS [Puniceicoccales bacterium]|nr:DNA mismatch repair protein MutS [Puniceicoccales bacterium]
MRYATPPGHFVIKTDHGTQSAPCRVLNKAPNLGSILELSFYEKAFTILSMVEYNKGETPMMQQYKELKKSIPIDALLLFRLGDFYELFNEDALIGSKILGITLTQRQNIPMAGIPHHSADTYIEKLIHSGYKVAICDQTEPARPGKIVHRQISKIFSPGTLIGENLLNPKHNHYLLSLKFHKNSISMAWLEVSTGEFQMVNGDGINDLAYLIFVLDPKEIIIDASDKERIELLPSRDSETLHSITTHRSPTELPGYYFDQERNLNLLLENFKVSNLSGYGVESDDPAIMAAGALILYVSENLRQKPNHITKIRKFQQQHALMIDSNTVRHLELFRNAKGGRTHTLLSTIDYTKTPMGARLLERMLMEPQINRIEITERHNSVEGFLKYSTLIDTLKKHLDPIADIPRILTRMNHHLRNPRELGSLRSTLAQLPEIVHTIEGFEAKEIKQLAEKICLFPELRSILDNALAENLPNDIADGGYIRDGFDEQVDRLRKLVFNTNEWLCEFERAEQQRTGIKNLHVKYNNNFGYFIEVTKANLNLVPKDYIRRQTTVNGERYVTEALKQREQEILSANEQLVTVEQEVLKNVVHRILQEGISLSETAETLAKIDVLSGWAQLAKRWNYCKPEIVDACELEIKGGRHPVIEKIIKESNHALAGMHDFIANDTYLSSIETQIALVTGPNMAGKSTYIRQVALIAILVQMGCWVPAKSCRMGLADRIFSRIGANDDLASGTSTFMVEMNETANILNNATERSLIILDEIGRGTSTYDGLSIAWAIVEFLHEHWHFGPRTLFATHYHELTRLTRALNRVKNFHIAVKEWNDEIIFLRSIEPGISDKSYGIHVAQLAGIPALVIQRANEILELLESEKNITQHILQGEKKSKIWSNQLNLEI